jgi:hypothetical protein
VLIVKEEAPDLRFGPQIVKRSQIVPFGWAQPKVPSNERWLGTLHDA